MECWNLTFNAQGSRVIIIVVHVRTIKVYVRVVEAFMENEKGGQNTMKISLPQKMWWNLVNLK
jgi:hypothetical protein